jgi:Xaa-Pro aminopeptidase
MAAPTEALLVSNYYNILYLTGFKGLADAEQEAWVIYIQSHNPEKKILHLFTDGRYFEHAKKLSQSNNALTVHLLSADAPLRTALNNVLSSEKIKSLDFEADSLTFDEYTKLSQNLHVKLVPTIGKIGTLRSIKTPDEINKIRKACEITDQCFSEIVKTIKVGQSESYIAQQIEFWLKLRGYDLAFYPIVAVDSNAAIPHHDSRVSSSTGNTQVGNHSIVLIDFGARFDNYCADMTRMISIGKPQDDFAAAYAALLYEQKHTIDHLNSTGLYKNIDIIARNDLMKAGYPSFQHSTGHGLGLEIHEAPRVAMHADEVKKPGHVITIEPGIYLEGKFGMRIEDTILINAEGNAEVLTQTSKELTVLEV